MEDFAHQLWLLTWDGELCNCPKKDGAKRVLDVGTGTGIWAMDYADAHPEATVYGVDLSPIQPGFVPPNCHFEIDDVDKEWTFSQPFDFVFMRAMIGSFRDWPKVLAQAYENLEPGGYFEIQDNHFPVVCDDDTLTEDSYMLKWTQYLIEATDKIGQPINVATSFQKLVEDAGFVDVEVRHVVWPTSAWPKDPKLAEIGKWCRTSFMQGLDGICLAYFTRVLGWTKEEVIVFCSQVRNEVRKGKIHGYFPVYSVWGRKPEKEASEGPQ
ncbi:methyltransferase domain-containing protein [Colletotrichum karsti]|uniref:Methyltransferase domain-containing protein n=1 Tax=Colletotrichum karsti TaxID=1095194 RepID=A0A9P6I7S3_9PEZI|nr:methyltransferase domain-containing protein [Colletotrichum karsti]KAF9877804.1 methyltransferase domain-containing protein [Colletotrichum karsti]